MRSLLILSPVWNIGKTSIMSVDQSNIFYDRGLLLNWKDLKSVWDFLVALSSLGLYAWIDMHTVRRITSSSWETFLKKNRKSNYKVVNIKINIEVVK